MNSHNPPVGTTFGTVAIFNYMIPIIPLGTTTVYESPAMLVRSAKGHCGIFSQDCFRKTYSWMGKVVFLVTTCAMQQTEFVSLGWDDLS